MRSCITTERGRRLLEDVLEAYALVALMSDECAVDCGWREPSEAVGGLAARICAEGELHLVPQARARRVADAVDDLVYLPLLPVRRLGRRHDQEPEEVGVLLERDASEQTPVTVRVARVWAVTSDGCGWFSGWRRADSRRLCRSA